MCWQFHCWNCVWSSNIKRKWEWSPFMHDAIKTLFRRKVKSRSSRQLTVQRNNTSLFGRLDIANQTAWRRPCTIIIFLAWKSNSLSDFGKIRSVLLTCHILFLIARYLMVLLWYTLCLQKLPIPSQTMLTKSSYPFSCDSWRMHAELI